MGEKGVGVSDGTEHDMAASKDSDRGEDRSVSVGVSVSGGGVARDVGTYKALIPILETASATSTPPSLSASIPASTSTSTSTIQIRSIKDIEKARKTLESVRRTGRIEGLIY